MNLTKELGIMAETLRAYEDISEALINLSSIENKSIHRYFCTLEKRPSSPKNSYCADYDVHRIKTTSPSVHTILNFLLTEKECILLNTVHNINPCLMTYKEAFDRFEILFQNIIFSTTIIPLDNTTDIKNKNRVIQIQTLCTKDANEVIQLLNAFLVYLFQKLKTPNNRLLSNKFLAPVKYRNNIIRKHLSYYPKNSDPIAICSIEIKVAGNEKNHSLEALSQIQTNVLRHLRNYIGQEKGGKQFKYIWKIQHSSIPYKHSWFDLYILSKNNNVQNNDIPTNDSLIHNWYLKLKSEIIEKFDKLDIKIDSISMKEEVEPKSSVLEKLLYSSVFSNDFYFQGQTHQKVFGTSRVEKTKKAPSDD